MLLTILSAKEKKVLSIAWIEVETASGNFVIQQQHIPTVLAVLAHQPITICLANGKQESFISPGGILEIQRNTALLLLNE
jgi:F0F1-type ATP synthase epsilon subunit